MKAFWENFVGLLRGDASSDRVVPPSGFTFNLTAFSAGIMAFLAVFAMAFSLASGRLADRWGNELARSSTIRISAPADQMAAQTKAVMDVLATTSGIAFARELTAEEQQSLLEPFFGPDVPVGDLPIPQLIDVIEDDTGFDATGLRQRLAAEAPAAVLDDHTRWRRPLVRAASRLRSLGMLSFVLIGAALAAMVTLAATAALSANFQVIKVLRLVGARDVFIAGAVVRRFSLRAVMGAFAGTFVGMGVLALMPSTQGAGEFLTNLGFVGAEWLWPLLIPVLSGAVGYVATRMAALRMLRRLH